MTEWKKGRLIVFMGSAGIVFVAGVILFIIFLFQALGGLTNDLERIQAPGQYDLALEAGGYTVFHETGNIVDGKVVGGGPIHGLRLAVTGSDGEPVAVGPAGTNSTYNMGGRNGYSIMQFKIDQPGKYTVNASFDEDSPGGPAIVTLAREFAKRLVFNIMGAIAIMFGAIIGGALLIVLGIIFSRVKS